MRLLVVSALVLQIVAPAHRSAAVLRQFQQLNPCPSTALPYGACPGFIRDHIVPRCAGGPDAVANLQWQTALDAKAKDAVERRQCAQLRRERRAALIIQR